MKQSTTLALTALFALAAAAPLEKRDPFTTTVYEDVTSTVDVYTTIFVSPGDPRLTSTEQAVVQITSSAPAVSVSPTTQPSIPPQPASQPPVVVPQQKQEAQVQAPAPTSTPIPSVTPQAVAQPEVKAPAPSAPVAPAQSSSAPASSPVPSPASKPSSGGPSGGSCGEVLGKCTAGDMTTFEGAGAAGACGYISPDRTPDYVALAVGMMGPQSNGGGSKNPYCDRTIKIKNKGVEYDAMITDKCPGCRGGDQSLDLSPSLFAKIFDGATTGNFHGVEWWFTN